jgi:hypothetical protein
MPRDLVFDFSPTQADFVFTDAHIAHLIGPMGEGKTFAGVGAMIHHAQRCKMNIRTAIIRDTHQNIKTSTIKSISEILGAWVTFKDDFKKMYIKTRPAVECDLFGIDDEASISKLQGPEYALIWLEEPAPIHERSNSGLPKEVFDIALARAGRQKGAIPRLQITQNPGDEEHWTTELMDDPEEYMVAEDGTVIIKKTFRIPKGENKYLTPLQRAMNMAAFKSDPGKWARYVEGETASVMRGKRVTPSYSPQIHYSQKILPVYPNMEGYRGWDSFQYPSVVIAQYNPQGQLVIHDVLAESGLGPKELIEEKLLPLLASPKYKGKIKEWRDIGDPNMKTPDQSSKYMSAAKVIEKTLGTYFERGPVKWSSRIDPVNHHLKRMLNEGRPAIILSASAVLLHRALKGGWHYKTDNNGKILGKLPVKDEHSHPGDAFSYIIAALMPYEERQAMKKIDKDSRMKRALSYGPGELRPKKSLYGGLQWP